MLSIDYIYLLANIYLGLWMRMITKNKIPLSLSNYHMIFVLEYSSIIIKEIECWRTGYRKDKNHSPTNRQSFCLSILKVEWWMIFNWLLLWNSKYNFFYVDKEQKEWWTLYWTNILIELKNEFVRVCVYHFFFFFWINRPKWLWPLIIFCSNIVIIIDWLMIDFFFYKTNTWFWLWSIRWL